MTALRVRRGFTLVELLVVTGLIASLLGLVLAGMRQGGSSQVRSLTQDISSAILVAQSRAIGNDSGSALVFVPGTGNLPTIAANSIFYADVPPFVTGSVAPPVSTTGTYDVPPRRMVSGSSTLVFTATTTVASLVLSNSDSSDLTSGYKIRFSGTSPLIPTGPWLNFAFLGVTSSTCTATVAFRPSANQTVDNLTWPYLPPGVTGAIQFEVARYPMPSNAAINTASLAAVDLRFSGVGAAFTGAYGSLANKGSITISFNRNGAFDSVMQSGTTATPTVAPIAPTAPLYLLVASLANIQVGSSLASSDSRWLVLAPGSGRMTVAPNITVSGTTELDVWNARASARQGLVGGSP